VIEVWRTVWAFIARKEDFIFLMMLKSIEAIFLHGVIAGQHGDNEAAVLAGSFCRGHAGFEWDKYPFDVLHGGSGEYFRSPPSEIRLDTYDNTVLSMIPGNVWLMKVDAD
jgi:beta-1,4-N-acetylgalactosaminyltransferase